MSSKTSFLVLAIVGGFSASACGDGDTAQREASCVLGPDETRETTDECSGDTPICSNLGRCSHKCTTNADCANLEEQTSCDSEQGLCNVPCTEDIADSYACVNGDRIFCADGAEVSCDLRL